MKKINTAKNRHHTKCKHLPVELAGRLQSLHEHRNLREQRDTFSSIIKHPGGTYRWNSHLLAIPHCHIIETKQFGEHLKVHVFHAQSGSILTLIYTNEKWVRKTRTTDDKIRNLIPDRFTRTGWLSKKSTRAQQGGVARVTGINKHALPPITAANANVLIHSSELLRNLNMLTSEISKWVKEIESTPQQRVI